MSVEFHETYKPAVSDNIQYTIYNIGSIRNFTKFINTADLEKCRHAG